MIEQMLMNRSPLRDAAIVLAILAVLSCALAACGSGVQGTYSDNSGSLMLELHTGGQATFTFMGEAAQCTYAVDGKKLTLTCKGEAGKTVFTIHDDGSLTGPPGSFMPALRKAKS